MSDSVDVDITMTFDAEDLDRILTATEVEVMQQYRKQMLQFIRKRWTGWKYERIPIERQGRSLEGWSATLQTTEGNREILIINDAVSYGKTPTQYAAYVRRSKGLREEWRIVYDRMIEKILPSFIDDLESSIDRNLSTPGPAKKVRRNKTSQQKIKTLEI